MEGLDWLRKKWWILLVVVLFFVALLLSFWAGQNSRLVGYFLKPDREAIEKHEKGYQFISPLLECQSPAAADGSWRKLERELNAFIKQSIDENKVSHISLYLRDLNNGPWIGVNEEEQFSPASLMKVPLLMSFFKEAETNPSLLDVSLTITLDRSQSLLQNILTDQQVVTGKEYSVKELLERMIKYSDNLAVNTLIDNTDPRLVQRVYADLEIFPEVGELEDLISVRNYAGFFRILYNSSYLNRTMSERALKLLSETTFKDGLVAGVPPGVTVSHKFGERVISGTKQLHDCGIVYRPDKPYLLCVMTRGQDFKAMKEVISSLSALVFKQF